MVRLSTYPISTSSLSRPIKVKCLHCKLHLSLVSISKCFIYLISFIFTSSRLMKLCNELHSHLHEIQKCFSQKVSISFFSKTLNGIDYNAFYMQHIISILYCIWWLTSNTVKLYKIRPYFRCDRWYIRKYNLYFAKLKIDFWMNSSWFVHCQTSAL